MHVCVCTYISVSIYSIYMHSSMTVHQFVVVRADFVNHSITDSQDLTGTVCIAMPTPQKLCLR
jgi:hypothetical protein